MNKRKKEQIYLFKRFLVRNGAYGLYQYCLERDANGFKEQYGFNGLREFLEKLEGKEFIAYAFDWSNTEKGHCFWESLDNKWRREINSHVYANN